MTSLLLKYEDYIIYYQKTGTNHILRQNTRNYYYTHRSLQAPSQAPNLVLQPPHRLRAALRAALRGGGLGRPWVAVKELKVTIMPNPYYFPYIHSLAKSVAGLLLRNSNEITIIQKAHCLLCTHSLAKSVTGLLLLRNSNKMIRNQTPHCYYASLLW